MNDVQFKLLIKQSLNSLIKVLKQLNVSLLVYVGESEWVLKIFNQISLIGKVWLKIE